MRVTETEYRHWADLLFVLGVLLVVLTPIAQALSIGPHPGLWYGIGSIYVLSGGLLGIARYTGSDGVSFPYALFVAACSAVLALTVRLVSLFAARPELSLLEVSPFVIWQVSVVVPVGIAFLVPLGVATRWSQRTVASLLLVSPFLVTIVQGMTSDPAFGGGFVVYYYCLYFVWGVVVGLPLYLVGRTLRHSPSQNRENPRLRYNEPSC